MFRALKLSFNEDHLAFLDWQLFWLIFQKLGDFFGHPGAAPQNNLTSKAK
jgi:hypothetical protein